VGDALMLPREDIDWQIDVPEDLEVHADRDQFYRVIANLVRNACEVLEDSPQGGEAAVRVSAWRQGELICLQVSDTGPGVPPKAQENLFTAFQGSLRNGGTGLGLAIASELVRAHGGRIELADNSDGATFRIELPDTVNSAPARASA